MCIYTYQMVGKQKPAARLRSDEIERIARTCVLLRVRRASRVVTQLYEQAFSSSDLHPMQFLLLIAVSRAGPAPVTALAEGLLLDRTTLTRNLAALVESKLVAIVPHPGDRRARIVTITPNGAEAIAGSYALWQDAQDRVTEQLGEPHLGHAIAELDRLASLE